MANEFFWNNPPWANGLGGYQMGLAPVGLHQWCGRAITPLELEAKLKLLREHYPAVVQATIDSSTAQELLSDCISEIHCPANAGTQLDKLANTDNNRPLVTAALCVPDDLCLLQRRCDHYELIAGCVTAPSYWCLSDKIGLGLAAVHDNVPGLNDRLGQRMSAFFDRLPAERCLLRRNWFLHGSDKKFQPEPERRARIITAASAANLTVRSETQTFRRLSEDVIAFTILVDCYPLKQIKDYPAAARALQSALKSRNENERLAASQDHYETGVLALLNEMF